MKNLIKYIIHINHSLSVVVLFVSFVLVAPIVSWETNDVASAVCAAPAKKNAKKQVKKPVKNNKKNKKKKNKSATKQQGRPTPQKTVLASAGNEYKDWQNKVAEVEKYNAKVAAYMTRDIDHRLGLWADFGYSAIFPFRYAEALTNNGFIPSVVGGAGGGAGLGYQLRYKTFLFTTGFEYRAYNSLTSISPFSRSFAILPYETMTYNYSYSSMRDKWQAGYLQMPFMFGMELADWYWQAGVKAGFNVTGKSSLKTLVTTTITDQELISDLCDIYNHALFTDVEGKTSEKISFGFNTAIAAEAGLLLDRWTKPKVNTGKKLTPAQQFAQNLHLRVALFAEYGVLNIYKQPLTTKADIPVDFSGVTGATLANPSDLIDKLKYSSTLNTSTVRNGILNPFLVGVKLVVWYSLPRKEKKMLPLPAEPRPRMAVQVNDGQTSRPLQGVQLAITNVSSAVQTNKTTNSKGSAVARLAKGEYRVSASKIGFLPSDTITFRHQRDLRDTIFFVLQPEVKTISPLLCGYVFAENSHLPLEAELRIVSKEDTTRIYSGTANEEGFFATDFLAGQYDLTISHKGYMPFAQTVTFERDTLSLYLSPIKQGVVTRIDNLYFATNKTYVLPESEEALESLTSFLLENPSVSILIVGHTDAVGSDEANMKLSLGRAKAVRTELIMRGIDAKRITYDGRGKTEPVATNDTEEGRQQNRRVEFEILHIDTIH